MTDHDEIRRWAEEHGFDLPGVFSRGNLIPDDNVTPIPVLLEPEEERGFRIRLDLKGTKPPIWRRLELPGDLTLDRLHTVIQVAMGWTDSHLHKFRTGSDPWSPAFLTEFDLSEGDRGMLEIEASLDQVVAQRGDRLWYEYDFGDGWQHVLTVEAVLDEPPDGPRCTFGRMACPPEDCGGVWGYEELADWVRGGCDPAGVPPNFDGVEHALEWLPPGWHPDRFDLDEVNELLTGELGPLPPVAEELAELLQQHDLVGNRALHRILARPESHGPAEVSEADAARLLDPFAAVLEVVGGGVTLTAAGHLPPALTEQLARRTRITDWWIGKANREDLTPPVARLRDLTRALGLLGLRKGALAPTAAARRAASDPLALWRHLVERMPLGRSEFDRQAGWVSLAVVGSGVPAEQWDDEIGQVLAELGWRWEGYGTPGNPTLEVFEQLAGKSRNWRIEGVDPALAATARAAIREPVGAGALG